MTATRLLDTQQARSGEGEEQPPDEQGMLGVYTETDGHNMGRKYCLQIVGGANPLLPPSLPFPGSRSAPSWLFRSLFLVFRFSVSRASSQEIGGNRLPPTTGKSLGIGFLPLPVYARTFGASLPLRRRA